VKVKKTRWRTDRFVLGFGMEEDWDWRKGKGERGKEKGERGKEKGERRKGKGGVGMRC
jgi:hypothetical protein